MVRRILLTTTAMVAMAGVAAAADLGTRPPPSVFAPPPVFTWTGFYIGATVGGISLQTKASEPYLYCEFSGPPCFDVVSSATNDGGGVIAGGTIGYNYQIGNIVLGLEGDWSYTGAQTNYSDNYYYVYGKTKLESLGTLRARLGFTPWDRTLVYVTGGAAWGDLHNALGVDYPASGYSQSSSSTHTGWTIGGGIEQALTDHITVKAEALYVDLGNTSGCDNHCGCRTSFKNTAVVGRVGLNFKF